MRKIFYSDTIIITIFTLDLIPNSWFQYIFAPQFRIKNIVTEPSYGTQESDRMSAPVPKRNWLYSHHLHPLSLHAQSELMITPATSKDYIRCPTTNKIYPL
jgi:hypothetical protein